MLSIFKKSKTPLILAPMAGLTHSGYRVLISQLGGADLFFSEMLSCAALIFNGPYMKYYMDTLPSPAKLIFQFTASEEELFCKTVKLLENSDAAGFDINMGCCAPEIRKQGAGIRWMDTIEKARSLIGRVRPLVKNRPLSAKIRLGEKENPEWLVSFASALEQEGLDFITLHPRTRKEKFSRRAKWQYVKLLNDELRIPVVGSGDIESFGDYKRVKEKYNPPAIMIGRAAIRKPWIFSHIKAKEQNPEHVSRIDLPDIWQRYFKLLKEHQPVDFYKSRYTRFFSYTCDNLAYGHNLKARIRHASSAPEAENIIEEYFARYPEFRIHEEKN